MSTAHALPTRSRFQPDSVGRSEKPKPGSEGITTSNASSALPPCAVGSVSGPMSLICSKTEPGQPCVMISGIASGWRDLTGGKGRWGVYFVVFLGGEEVVLLPSPFPRVLVRTPVANEFANFCQLRTLRL